MDQDATVAVVRGDNRRSAAAEALALIVDDLRASVTSSVVVVPHPRTHADMLSAVLDALFHAGAIEAVIVEEPRQADRLGHRGEVFGRPVRFVDPEETGTRDLVHAIARSSCIAELWRLGRGGSLSTTEPATASPAAARVVVVDAFDALRTMIAGTDADGVTAVALQRDRPSLQVVGDLSLPRRPRPHWRLRFQAPAGRQRVV